MGLAFISYPDALSTLPVPQLFTVMFFFMLFLLGIDSEFALLETVLTCVYDGIPALRRHKPVCTFLLCSSCFLLSLSCVSMQVNMFSKSWTNMAAECLFSGSPFLRW